MFYYCFWTFFDRRLFITGAGTKAPDNKMNNQPYKRQYRQIDDDVKQRISASTRNKPKSEQHREHIRQGMLQYWETVPDRPENNDEFYI